MIANFSSMEGYYKDLREGHNPFRIGLIIPELIQMEPMPCHVLLPSQLQEFNSLPPERKTELLKVFRHATAYDCFVVMLRMMVARGVHPEKSEEPRLYELALHRFGYDSLADYVVKGAIAELLFPGAKEDPAAADVPFEVLMEHDMVKRAVWGHRSMHFFCNAIRTRKDPEEEFEFRMLSHERNSGPHSS